MISVIIPIYNTGDYLKRCIDSILMQTYKELQIILVNDGSVDHSLSVMKEYEKKDSRILIIDRIHEGVSAARNAGLEMAAGEYVSFIDSDDWIEPDMYQIIYDILIEHNADRISCEWIEEYSDGTSTTKKHKGEKKVVVKGDEVIKKYLKNDINMHKCGLVKKSLLKDFFFEVGRERGEDMLFNFQTMVIATCIVYVDIPLYHRYHRVGSLSNRVCFNPKDYGRSTCTDIMVDYIQKNKPQFLQDVYAFSFKCYMLTLNLLSYFRCEKENAEIYYAVNKRLHELWNLMDSPMRVLPKTLSGAYIIFRLNKTLYHYIMIVYYRYIKKELGGKRQR